MRAKGDAINVPMRGVGAVVAAEADAVAEAEAAAEADADAWVGNVLAE